MDKGNLEARLAEVRERMAAAAQSAGRPVEQVRLVAASKTVAPSVMAEIAALGVTCFGENRVEEAEVKLPAVRELLGESAFRACCWCLIGHLQSRKAGRALEVFDQLHTVDSLHLAERLNRLAANRASPVPILLEVNTSGEATKFGLSAAGWPDDRQEAAALLTTVESILALPHLQVRGLMTVGPLVADPELARPAFRRLRFLRDALAERWPEHTWLELSMGMSDDYTVAIEEGSTMVRLGRALFGPRG
ncbi:MAG: YggS family pyridoxal phosphate-dependent enzyme [Anaerolineae bacterium]